MGTGRATGEPWERGPRCAISWHNNYGTTGLVGRAAGAVQQRRQPSRSAPGVEPVCAGLAGSKQWLRYTHGLVTAPESRVAACPGAPVPAGVPLDSLLVLRGQELGDAVGDEADGGQWHGRAFAEGEDVEEQLNVGGRFEGIKEV